MTEGPQGHDDDAAVALDTGLDTGPEVGPEAAARCTGREQGSPCVAGDTCLFSARIIASSEILGGCTCQSDLTWSCEITVGAAPPVDASVAPVDASVEPVEAAVEDVVAKPAVDANCCLDPTGQDGQNLQYAPADVCTNTSVAWEYVPPCDFDATRIELYNSSGPVGILGDTGGNPSPNLWTALLPAGTPHAWNGIDIVPPVHLVGGQTYFIYEGSPVCSIATGGVSQTFWLYDPNSGRQGPFNKYPFTFRINGTCSTE
jgi:hypothetical protein